MKEVLYTIAGKLLPAVFHIGARALPSHSLNVHAGHDDVMAVADCGWGVLFGRNDILVNNIAWVLRHMPFFGVFGDGKYRLRPLHVDDMAELLIKHGNSTENAIIDAIGPETFTYKELVHTLSEILEIRRLIIGIPPLLGYGVSKLINPFLHDVIITREEIKGLMRGLLDSDNPATGVIKLTKWAKEQRETLGRKYASEVGRRRSAKG